MKEENKCHCKDDINNTCNCDDNCKCDDNCGCKNADTQCKEELNEKCECNCKKESKEKKGFLKKEKNKHKEELENLIVANKKLEQDVLVAKADLINYRKRKDEEVTRMLKFCNEDLIKQFLPILDNFERAIKLDDDNLEDEVSKFLEGFKMIYCNMQSIMKNFEVIPIDGTNKPFDPVYHNAIMVEHRDGVESGMVLEVLQKGYIYKDKVIRPAMVKVSE